MKVIVVGGYPGVGKSAIVREVIDRLDEEQHFVINKYEKLVPHMLGRDVIVLGTYNKDETFPGTDRFAMNAQPEVMQFLQWLKDTSLDVEGNGFEYIVLFEGDRLFNGKMLDWLYQEGFQRVLCIVQAEQTIVKERREQRSEQNETWRKGRQTKVDRIKIAYQVDHVLLNNTQTQFNNSVQELIDEIKGTWKSAPASTGIKNYWK